MYILSVFPGLQFVSPDQVTLLGSPLGTASLMAVLESQINKLQLIERLHHLHVHDALTLLRHFFSVPKLLHVLRTSPAFQAPLLSSWAQLLHPPLSPKSPTPAFTLMTHAGSRQRSLCGLMDLASEGPPMHLVPTAF